MQRVILEEAETKFFHDILRDKNRNRRLNMKADKAKRHGTEVSYISEPHCKGLGVFSLAKEVVL